MNTFRILSQACLASALAPVLLGSAAHAAAVPIDPRTVITATMDGGTAKTGNTWYEVGANTAAPATGLKTGLVAGQTDPLSTYLFQPAGSPNALMLDNAAKSGSLNFNFPLTLAAFSIVGASGNGAGSVTPTLHFADSTTSVLGSATVGDWFNNEPRVQTVAGRIDVVGNTFNNVAADNPRIPSVSYTLSAADAGKALTGISLDWTGGATTHTAIFGVSGDFTGLGHFSAIPLTPTSFNQDMIVGAVEVGIPEPGALTLFGLGALGLMLASRRRQRA